MHYICSKCCQFKLRLSSNYILRQDKFRQICDFISSFLCLFVSLCFFRPQNYGSPNLGGNVAITMLINQTQAASKLISSGSTNQHRIVPTVMFLMNEIRRVGRIGHFNVVSHEFPLFCRYYVIIIIIYACRCVAGHHSNQCIIKI